MSSSPKQDVKVLVAPHLHVQDAAAALSFYEQAFGAVEAYRLTSPDGTIIYAEVRIGGAPFSLGEATTDGVSPSPMALGGSGVAIDFIVPDVDALVSRAVAAGASVVFPVQNQFYGMRGGRIKDPFGHVWIVSTPIEDVTPDEMQRRFNALMQQG
jgi:PhnB protein